MRFPFSRCVRPNVCGEVVALCQVLYVFGHGDPSMHPIFIDRKRWCREGRLRDGTDGNGNAVLSAFHEVVDRGTAGGAEGEPGPSALVSNTNIVRARSADFDCLPRKPGLSGKDATRSTLTGVAVTNRHPDRFSNDFGGKLAATTRRDSMCHGGRAVGKKGSSSVPKEHSA